jgi:hypothetical protein
MLFFLVNNLLMRIENYIQLRIKNYELRFANCYLLYGQKPFAPTC